MELNTSPAIEPTPAQAEIAKRLEQASRAAIDYLDTLNDPVAGLQRLPLARAMIEAGLSVLDLGKSARITELEGQLAIARQATQAACQQADEDALRMLPSTLPRQLLGRIVDQVFDGAVEDTTVIEDIYEVIACAGAVQGAKPESEPAVPAGLPFGIIDPDYARAFTCMRIAAWQHGYAIAMHGSFTRDLDLVAVPWTSSACSPERLVQAMEYRTGLKRQGPPSQKEHHRLAWSLLFPGFEDPRWIDFSVLPRSAQPTLESPQSADARDAARYRYLRGRDLDSIPQGGIFAGITPDNLVINGADLDNAIDDAVASLAATQTEGTPA